MTNGDDDEIEFCVQAGILPRVMELLTTNNLKLLTPVLRLLGNVVTGKDEQTDDVLSYNPLPTLVNLLKHSRVSLRKEVCWIISNITAGTELQIQKVLEIPDLIQRLITILSTDVFEVKKEASWAVSNAITGANPDQIRYIVDQGAINPICDLLTNTDKEILMISLEALQSILEIGKNSMDEQNPYADTIEEGGALPLIENLLKHPNEEISKKSQEIISTYFSDLQDDLDEDFISNSPDEQSNGDEKFDL
eukprot:Anaeramoba_ignava/c20184_g1_i4.p1 GENE.c20184_g1_i4~~c20184_g1_i4.p1  ORF type:complete len:250 (-),score=95.50 c20184_g1_i4:36-785(-)